MFRQCLTSGWYPEMQPDLMAKWMGKNADGGSSVKCGFEFEPGASNKSDSPPLINCQPGLWIPHLFAAAIGS